VVIIAFGIEEGARRWKKDTGCPFPLYLDKSRYLYQYFGMRRSLRMTFGHNTMIYFVGKSLGPPDPNFQPNPYPDLPDDRIQMAGDVVLNEKGDVEYCYPNTSPSDRTSVLFVLEILKKMNNRS